MLRALLKNYGPFIQAIMYYDEFLNFENLCSKLLLEGIQRNEDIFQVEVLVIIRIRRYFGIFLQRSKATFNGTKEVLNEIFNA